MFTEDQAKRLAQWSNVYGWTAEQCAAAAEKDETLRRLLAVEMTANDVTEDARAIREQITRIEVCHRQVRPNVERILQMIADLKPTSILACGQVDRAVAAELRGLMTEAASWIDGRLEEAGEVGALLGEQTPAKRWLAACLCKTLGDQLRSVQGVEPLPQAEWPG